MTAELYPWLKALHVAAAFAFVAGVVGVSVFLAANRGGGAGATAVARRVRRWDQVVTTPAMLLVWGFGIVLATAGHWFPAGWLQAKLVFVVVLSGIHGVQSGQLRRLATGGESRMLPMAPIALACMTAIVVLVILKP